MKQENHMLALLAVTVATCLFFHAYVEALIITGLFLPETVISQELRDGQ